MKKSGACLLLGLALALCFFAGSAQAFEMLSLRPGESTVREFPLFDKFDISEGTPIETFLVLGTGDNATKLGDLTITEATKVTKDFGATVYYKLIGFAYPLGGGIPTFISLRTTVPLSLTKTVKMSALYGIVLLGTFIQSIDGDVVLPVQTTLTLSWAVAAKK